MDFCIDFSVLWRINILFADIQEWGESYEVFI